MPAVLTPMILHSLWDAPALSIDLGAKMALLAAVYAVTLALFAAVWICAGRSDTRRGRDDPAELQRSDAIELLDTAQHPDQEDRG